MAESNHPQEAQELFHQAWDEATYDFEKFIAAYYIAQYQKDAADALHWYETALQIALQMNDATVQSAFAPLYGHIAKCYENLGEPDKAKEHYAQSASFKNEPSDKGPFYHGTKADLQAGDFLTPRGESNYRSDITMHHIYFTALMNGAGLAAALAKGDGPERVYIVEPTGSFEDDPNVTNKYFPGNQTRSYRSEAPLKILGEVRDWEAMTPEDLQKFRERVVNNKGEIIN